MFLFPPTGIGGANRRRCHWGVLRRNSGQTHDQAVAVCQREDWKHEPLHSGRGGWCSFNTPDGRRVAYDVVVCVTVYLGVRPLGRTGYCTLQIPACDCCNWCQNTNGCYVARANSNANCECVATLTEHWFDTPASPSGLGRLVFRCML